MEIPSRTARLAVLLAVTAVAAAVVFRMDPIPQDPAYHRFADTRPWLGVPNFQNVASNLPFLIVGGDRADPAAARLRRRAGIDVSEQAAWIFLFLGMVLTAFGSSWYHLAPSNATLVWDRLPMTLGFMGFFAGVIGERISQRAYRLLLWPLAGVGVASVLYWYASETQGRGRPPALRAGAVLPAPPDPPDHGLLPSALQPWQPALRRAGFLRGGQGVRALGPARSSRPPGDSWAGHALKHLAAAVACWVLVRMFSVRVRL